MLRRVVQSSRVPQTARALSLRSAVRDIKFNVYDVHQLPSLWAEAAKRKPELEAVNKDLVDVVLENCASMCDKTIFPLYLSSDQPGTKYDPATQNVITAKGFKEAMKVYNEGGWNALCVPTEFGGQGLPPSLHLAKAELVGTANWPFSMFPMLSSGALNTLLMYGTPQQKAKYIPKLASGEWSGTMCLTEAGAGTDLAQVRTKAVPIEGCSESGAKAYKISGQKIFISSGDHDCAENILHIVLARLPDAPEGIRGISLFLVPKFVTDVSGVDSKTRNCKCISIEHKMGIHGSPTCTLEFDNAVGFLIGKPNSGVAQMFTFMNHARMGVAVQAISHTELAHQNAVAYARQRMSGRSHQGVFWPNKPGDPIICHPDVRRMLFFIQSIAEGGRWLLYKCGKLEDEEAYCSKEEAEAANRLLGLLTPIAKGFLTEMSCEAAYWGMQVYGGHGYVTDHGMEQIYRDARISTMYEGTTGIQAQDLLGRKMLLEKPPCSTVQLLGKIIGADCAKASSNELLSRGAKSLLAKLGAYNTAVGIVAKSVMSDKGAMNANVDDNLRALGYMVLGWGWLNMALAAQAKLKNKASLSAEDVALMESKLACAQFYFDRLLPRASGHIEAMTNPTDALSKTKNDVHVCEWAE